MTNKADVLAYMAVGSATSGTIGQFLLQGIGTIVLGILGAFGGWLFYATMKPQLDKLKAKIGKKLNN